MAEFVIFGS